MKKTNGSQAIKDLDMSLTIVDLNFGIIEFCQATTEGKAGSTPPTCPKHSSKLNIFVTFKANYVYLMKKVNDGPIRVFNFTGFRAPHSPLLAGIVLTLS